MKSVATFLLLLSFAFVLAQQKPEPFGLKLGISTKEETLNVIKKEGGRTVDQGYKVIKGNIVNPNVEGYDVEGLPIDDLQIATFWFYKNKLYKIVYKFPLSMNKDEFYVLSDKLKSQYGNPKRYVKPYLADGWAEWDFGDVRITLSAPWVSWGMYLIYEHVPTSRQVEASDQEVLRKETSKPTKGF